MSYLERWRNSPEKLAKWRELWTDPIMKEGILLIAFTALPRPLPKADDVTYLEHGAILNAKREGFTEAIHYLMQFGDEPEPEIAEPDSWEHTLDPEQ